MYIYNLGLKFKALEQENSKGRALIINKKNYTFSDLDEKSNQIVNWMIKNNLKSGDIICISSLKSFLTFSIIIACLKLGVAYAILDRKSPFERLKKIILRINPKIIIVDDVLNKNLDNKKIKTRLKKFKDILTNLKKEKTFLQNFNLYSVPSSSIAYLMFTSGSTGEPKGVAISHDKVLNFSNWCKREYNISNKSIVTNLNALFFDNSIFDIFGGLFNGSCLIPISRNQIVNPRELIKYLEKTSVTIWFSVPSLLIYMMKFFAINKKSLPTLNKIIFGGEGFPKNSLKKLYDQVGKRIELINVYGPTECTCICSSYKISVSDFKKKEMTRFAPLGKQLAKNFYYLILDRNKNRVKIGQIGELYIGGDNVGLGYYNLVNETEKKFIQNPLHNSFRDIVYQSGDLVCKDPKSKYIYFSSRLDNQIKLSGYRIELDEIEYAIGSINKVIENAVTFGKKNEIEEITCWLVHDSNLDKIKTKLSFLLPTYMLPRVFIEKDKLPKNNNGKIDKKKLKTKYYDKK